MSKPLYKAKEVLDTTYQAFKSAHSQFKGCEQPLFNSFITKKKALWAEDIRETTRSNRIEQLIDTHKRLVDSQ